MPRRYHSVVFCKCPRTALCEQCRLNLYAQLRGVAARRGDYWAERVAAATSTRQTWPPHEGRAAAIARRLVGDIADDPLLLEMLAAELAEFAARAWATGLSRDRR
jgi:hypothetical protein